MFSCKKQNKTVSQFKAYYVGYNKALLFSKSTSLFKENTHLRQQPHKSILNCSMETHTQCTEAWYQSDDHNSGSFRYWVFFWFCFFHRCEAHTYTCTQTPEHTQSPTEQNVLSCSDGFTPCVCMCVG